MTKLTQNFNRTELMKMHTGIVHLIQKYENGNVPKKATLQLIALRKKIETAWEYPELLESVGYTMGEGSQNINL
jgi:hypothetical protein